VTHGHSEIGRLLDEPAYARAAAQALQALATPSRLRILARLHEGSASVGQLADSVDMDPSAVSHQLRLLRHLGLVTGERAGRQVVYELYDDHVGELLSQAVGHVEHIRLGLPGRHTAAEDART
jgi:DNA-binding transcriptional ArsR family regulator